MLCDVDGMSTDAFANSLSPLTDYKLETNAGPLVALNVCSRLPESWHWSGADAVCLVFALKTEVPIIEP